MKYNFIKGDRVSWIEGGIAHYGVALGSAFDFYAVMRVLVREEDARPGDPDMLLRAENLKKIRRMQAKYLVVSGEKAFLAFDAKSDAKRALPVLQKAFPELDEGSFRVIPCGEEMIEVIGTYQVKTRKLFPYVGDREVGGHNRAFCRCPDCGVVINCYAVQGHKCPECDKEE